MMKKGQLILLPNVLNPEETVGRSALPLCLELIVPSIDGLICESEKEGRSFLKRFTFPEGKTFRDIPLKLLNEHMDDNKHLEELLKPLMRGEVWGLISDCGLVSFADPGSQLVAEARKKNIEIEAYVGPSSIILALLLSGFNAQSFSFHGYLPREDHELKKKLLDLKLLAEKYKQTQLFIETPYRNDKVLQVMLDTLPASFKVGIALNIGSQLQEIIIKDVKSLVRDKGLLKLHKRPAVFMLSSI